MHYYLYKLKFTTPVHFGADVAGIGVEKCSPTCHADTFFSALCHEILHLYGEEELNNWVDKAKNNQFLISDLFPYNGDELFLPKPCYVRQEKEEHLDKTFEDNVDSSIKKKKMKKLKYVPIGYWESYLEYLFSEEKDYDPEQCTFYEEILTPKVHILRDEDDNQLYSVGAYMFNKESGLYFIVQVTDQPSEKRLRNIVKSLGLSGIGGERSSGYGKFDLIEPEELTADSKIYQEKHLYDILSKKDTEHFVSLSVVAPEQFELEDLDLSYYLLVNRKGFVASSAYSSTPVKRKPVVMFGAGSVFTKKLKGNVLDLKSSEAEIHPVWRYGKAMMVGI